MKTKREKKVQKIRHICLWPSILGTIVLFLFVIIFGIITIALFSANFLSSKFSESQSKVHDACAVFADMEGDGKHRFDTISSINSQLKGISYLDSSYETIQGYGEEFPKLEGMFVFNAVSEDWPDDVVFVSDEMDSLISTIFTNAFESNIVGIRIGISIDNSDSEDALFFGQNSSEEITGCNMYFVIMVPSTGELLGVVYRVSMYSSDYAIIIIPILTAALLCLFVLIAQFCTLLKVFRNKKRINTVLEIDPVTAGKNRYYFVNESPKKIKKAWKKKVKCAVVQIRVEKYKGIVNCYGVKEAEELLSGIYESAKKLIRHKGEIVAHFDNGDFGLLLMYESPELLEGRIRGILDKISSDNNQYKLYYNVGICDCNQADLNGELLYNNASLARATSKDENSGEIIWFDAKLNHIQQWERKVENEMENALKEGQFHMYLQPKYGTRSEVLSGAEALVRWIHPTDGLISPGQFIPIFEKNGFITKLDDFMISEVARQQAQWLKEGRQLVPISVNVSRAHFLEEDLADQIKAIVDRYAVPYKYIELELTESAFFDDRDQLIDIVKKMRNYGFMVSMDDFGSGYSSLNSLKEIPLDVVKIDAEFFRGEDNLDRGRLIVEETIDLSKKLGMKIVAEGIETRDQVDFLASTQCDLIQGYYFAKPMSIKDFNDKYYAG